MLPASREQPAPCKDRENKDTTYAPERLFSLKTTAGEPAATRRMQVKFFRPAGQRAPRGSTAWPPTTCRAQRREPQNRPPGRVKRAALRSNTGRLAPPNGHRRHAQSPGVTYFRSRVRPPPPRKRHKKKREPLPARLRRLPPPLVILYNVLTVTLVVSSSLMMIFYIIELVEKVIFIMHLHYHYAIDFQLGNIVRGAAHSPVTQMVTRLRSFSLNGCTRAPLLSTAMRPASMPCLAVSALATASALCLDRRSLMASVPVPASA